MYTRFFRSRVPSRLASALVVFLLLPFGVVWGQGAEALDTGFTAPRSWNGWQGELIASGPIQLHRLSVISTYSNDLDVEVWVRDGGIFSHEPWRQLGGSVTVTPAGASAWTEIPIDLDVPLHAEEKIAITVISTSGSSNNRIRYRGPDDVETVSTDHLTLGPLGYGAQYDPSQTPPFSATYGPRQPAMRLTYDLAPMMEVRDAATQATLANETSHALSSGFVPGAATPIEVRVENNGLAPLELEGNEPATVTHSSSVRAWVSQQPDTSIAPNGQTTLQVTAVASDAQGSFHLQLSFSTNDPKVEAYTVQLVGSLKDAPRAVLHEPHGRRVRHGEEVELADRLVGRRDRAVFELHNKGTAALTTQQIGVNPSSLENTAADIASAPDASIAPGESAPIELSVEPSAHGPFAFTLQVESNDPHEPVIAVPVRGFAAASARARIQIERFPGRPVESVDQVGLAFGEASVRWKVRNVGTEAATLESVEGRGLQNANVTLDVQPATIPRGETLPVDVTLTPQYFGSVRAELDFSFGDSPRAPAARTLEIHGEVTGSSRPLLQVLSGGDGLPIESDAPLALGRLGAGQGKHLHVTLHNAGSSMLIFGEGRWLDVQSATNAEVTFSEIPFGPLAPGETASLPLTVTPQQPGPFEASVTLNTNDPQSNPFVLQMQGKEPAGRLEVRRPALVTLAPESTDRQLPLTRGQRYELIYTVANAGGAPLTINPSGTGATTAITEANGASASLSNPPAMDTTLEPGESRSLLLSFTPRQATYAIEFAVVSDDVKHPSYTLVIEGAAAEAGEGCAHLHSGPPITYSHLLLALLLVACALRHRLRAR